MYKLINILFGLRESRFHVIWKIIFPLRFYLKFFPFQRGKGVLLRTIFLPLLPSIDSEFELYLPNGGKISLKYRETIGWSSLLYGTFELAELEFVGKYLRPNSKVIDIGANVGLFTVLMSVGLRNSGSVWAFEPVPLNIERLKKNLNLNDVKNTRIFPYALGEKNGQNILHLANDSAYNSFVNVESRLSDGKDIVVEIKELDDLWDNSYRPQISFIKIDVEGFELEVLKGATRLIKQCLPTMLIEANTLEQFESLFLFLKKYDYEVIHPPGFAIHNYIFYNTSVFKNVNNIVL